MIMQEQEPSCQWNQEIQKSICQLPCMKPKLIFKVIDLLKQQNISTVKMKLGFISENEKRKYQQIKKKQQSEEYFRDFGHKDEVNQSKRDLKIISFKNGCQFCINSYIRSDIFMQAYKDKLKELAQNFKIAIQPLGPDLYIQGNSNVKPGSIVYSQLTVMYKQLKICVFYDQPLLLQIVQNSQDFKKKLLKIGIKCYVRQKGTRRNVAFYSSCYEPEQIRKQVLKQNSFQHKVLKLSDSELSNENNLRIFDVVVRSIRNKIENIKKTYDAQIQVNKNLCCFVLHLKHQIFGIQLAREISNVVNDLLIMSFRLRNSRAFINKLRRNSKEYPFIHATNYNKVIFCCINKTKITSKKDLIQVLRPFLQELNQNSSLTIHLKPIYVLQGNQKIFDKIIDLVDSCNLQVQHYAKIIQGSKFNIEVKPKNLNMESKTSQKKIQLCNFVLKLFQMPGGIQMTEQQFSAQTNSILPDSTTEDSTNSNESSARRGNRVRTRTTQVETKKQTIQQKQRIQQKKYIRQKSYKNETKKMEKQQNQIDAQKQKRQQQMLPTSQSNDVNANLPIKCKIKNIKQDSKLQHKFVSSLLLDDGKFMKSKPDRQLEELLKNNYSLNAKACKLKINAEFFPLAKSEDKIQKEQAYLVESILKQDGCIIDDITTFKFKCLDSLVNNWAGYLIYLSIDQTQWVPTHYIQIF